MRPVAARRSVGSVVAACFAVSMLALTQLFAATPAAHADSGMTVESTSRYVYDPAAAAVSGTITMTLENVTPNEPTAGGYRYYFYDSYGIPLPAGADDVQAESNGRSLAVTSAPIDSDGAYRMFEIRFPDLRYRETRTIELTFTLNGQPPRSADPTRIGPGFANFPVFGPGDPGTKTVEVVVPEGLNVESTTQSFSSDPGAAGTVVYSTTEDNLSPGFAATMSIRSDEVGEGFDVTVGGVELSLVPYPGDDEWVTFIEERADVGLPVLVDLVGERWPGDVDQIRADAGSAVRGFDGWYSTSDREIVLGEALDDGILYHELAHAWVNSATMEDRWLSEGLAEFLAEQTAERTEGSFTTPAEVSPNEDAAIPLQTWTESPGFRTNDLDQWAYPASYQVMTALLEGASDEQLRAILNDSVTVSSPWDLEGRRDLSGGQLSSRTFLDLLSEYEVPTSTDGTASALYADWVLDPEGQRLLDSRQPARDAYDAFAQTSPWGAPLGLRRAMARWEYRYAIELTESLAEVGELSATVEELSDQLSTPVPDSLQSDYQSADTRQEYDAVATSLRAAKDALNKYRDARAVADQDFGYLSGLAAAILRLQDTADVAQSSITDGHFAASEHASDLTLERADNVTTLTYGLIAAAVALVLLLIGVALLIRRLSRRRAHKASAAYT